METLTVLFIDLVQPFVLFVATTEYDPAVEMFPKEMAIPLPFTVRPVLPPFNKSE